MPPVQKDVYCWLLHRFLSPDVSFDTLLSRLCVCVQTHDVLMWFKGLLSPCDVSLTLGAASLPLTYPVLVRLGPPWSSSVGLLLL